MNRKFVNPLLKSTAIIGILSTGLAKATMPVPVPVPAPDVLEARVFCGELDAGKWLSRDHFCLAFVNGQALVSPRGGFFSNQVIATLDYFIEGRTVNLRGALIQFEMEIYQNHLIYRGGELIERMENPTGPYYFDYEQVHYVYIDALDLAQPMVISFVGGPSRSLQ